VKKVLNKIGKVPLCNGKPERAPHVCGKCFILCWRCSMVVLFSIMVTLLITYSKIFIMKIPFAIIALLLIVPMIVDGVAQYLLHKESNNSRRIITGSLFGCGIAILAYQCMELLRSYI
jgi:uncharacterized membrane protein